MVSYRLVNIMLEVKNLHYCWPNSIEQHRVVANTGEFLFINGRSGIGKTAFLKFWQDFTNRCQVRFYGKGLIYKPFALERPISVMFQK